jgi:dienelactone hydrolase
MRVIWLVVFALLVSCQKGGASARAPAPSPQPGEAQGGERQKPPKGSGKSPRDSGPNGASPASGDDGDSPRDDDVVDPSDGDETARPPKPSQPEVVSDPGATGPYAVTSYAEGLADAGYASAVVYVPKDARAARLPATSLVGGYTNTKEDVVWMAEQLASHGYIVLAFTPTNNFSGDAGIWAQGHQAALRKLTAEDGRQGSPIFGKVDRERLGLVGFSMGGAGTVIAANSMPEVRAAIALCAYRPETPSGSSALMMITGTADTVADPGAIEAAYASMTSDASHALLSFKDLGHGDVLRSTRFRPQLAKYMTAFFQLELAGIGGYERFFTGSQEEAERSRLFARYEFDK